MYSRKLSSLLLGVFGSSRLAGRGGSPVPALPAPPAPSFKQSQIGTDRQRWITRTAISKAPGSRQSRIGVGWEGRITGTTLPAASFRASCFGQYARGLVGGQGPPAPACQLKR